MAQSSFDETSRMLAQANLHRMRGEWDQAIDICMDAMRMAPDDPTAHSLLGDIYSDKGSLDEAIRWYCMALDLQPTSRADRAKLSRLVEAKRQSLIAADQKDPHTTLRLRRRRNQLAPDRTVLGHGVVWRHDRTVRNVVVAVAGLMLLVIAAVPVVTHVRNLHPNSLAPLAIGRQINAAPVYLQPVAPAYRGVGQSLAAAGPTTLRDPSDQQIVDSLRSDTGLLYEGIQIADAQSDPRQSRMTLTFLDNTANAPTADYKTQVLANSLRLAAAAAARTPATQISRFTVRCLLLTVPQTQDSGATLPPASGATITAMTPLVFVADIPRESIPPTDPGNQSSASMQALFTSPWFAPSLQ